MKSSGVESAIAVFSPRDPVEMRGDEERWDEENRDL
jgi:hypothetical protein